ncbi:cation/h(+) antiporter 1 [Quercus suber]|uniref:Cation/h(+) antiporter 1 n=1 Tax=Quercus suber TaxID=58331 RepID=A0AAW0KFM1_QUESU
MDATHRIACQENLFNPLTSMGMQVSGILVISHFFHLLLKGLGQPGPIAQIFAGLVLGPTGLSNIPLVNRFFYQSTGADFYEIFGLFCRIIFMFLIGLETDIPYIRRNNIAVVTAIAFGGAIIGMIFGLATSAFLHHELEVQGQKTMFMAIIVLLLAYTASPVVIRLAAELKFDTSDIGRLAIISSLIIEMTCLAIFNLIIAIHANKVYKYGIYCVLLNVVIIFINKYLADWFNKRDQNQKYLKNTELFVILSLVIGSAMAVVALLMSKHENLLGNMHTELEIHDPDKEELRMLACVYGPRPLSAILSLVSALSGSQKAPITPYLMQLIELPPKRRTNVSYHELEADELSDEEDYGGNDALEINEAVDNFTSETKILVRVTKAVSCITTLYEDVCNSAEDLRVSIILLPFHKHQRIDGKMDIGKEGIRTTNQKVLRHAPCSVGIIVSRGIDGVPGFLQLLGSDTVQHMATLFFGGPDDREAIAWSRGIAAHPRVNLTIIRFLPASSSSNARNSQINDSSDEDDGMFVTLSRLENGNEINEIDNAFMYVTSGQVGYVEKYVNNAAQTAAALKDIGDMYSLFIVGKGGRGNSPLTTGICDWEECPELGTIGDFLASSDFNINGSVLVVQQHRQAKKDVLDD